MGSHVIVGGILYKQRWIYNKIRIHNMGHKIVPVRLQGHIYVRNTAPLGYICDFNDSVIKYSMVLIKFIKWMILNPIDEA